MSNAITDIAENQSGPITETARVPANSPEPVPARVDDPSSASSPSADSKVEESPGQHIDDYDLARLANDDATPEQGTNTQAQRLSETTGLESTGQEFQDAPIRLPELVQQTEADPSHENGGDPGKDPVAFANRNTSGDGSDWEAQKEKAEKVAKAAAKKAEAAKKTGKKSR